MLQQPIGYFIRTGGAAWAAFVQWLPVFPQPHKMIDDELAAAFKQIPQTYFTLRPFECIILFDLHHGQTAPPGVELVALSGEFFLLFEQLFAFLKPLFSGYDSGEMQI